MALAREAPQASCPRPLRIFGSTEIDADHGENQLCEFRDVKESKFGMGQLCLRTEIKGIHARVVPTTPSSLSALMIPCLFTDL